jgi:hypothetical protein
VLDVDDGDGDVDSGASVVGVVDVVGVVEVTGVDDGVADVGVVDDEGAVGSDVDTGSGSVVADPSTTDVGDASSPEHAVTSITATRPAAASRDH